MGNKKDDYEPHPNEAGVLQMRASRRRNGRK